MNKLQGKISNTIARGFVVRFGTDAKFHKKEAKWLVDDLFQLFSEMLEEIIPVKRVITDEVARGHNACIDEMRQKAKEILK